MADLTTLLAKFLEDLYSGSIGGSAQWSSLTLTKNALGTTSTAASTLTNTTAAAAGAQQISPGFDLVGQGWKTNATAASQEVRWRQEVLPVQGTSAPTSTWKLKASVNAGAFTEILTASATEVASSVPLTVTGTLTSRFTASASTNIASFGNSTWDGSANGSGIFIGVGALTGDTYSTIQALQQGGGGTNSLILQPSGGSVGIGGTDVFLSRGAAGRIDTTKSIRYTPVAFAALPTAAEGAVAWVNDSNTETWGATVAAGGAFKVFVVYNGTNWTVAGK